MNSQSDRGDEPRQWIEAYRQAQMSGLPVDPSLQERVRASLNSIAGSFLYSQTAAEVFSRIMSCHGPVAPTLRAMFESGFLGRYIPEFDRISTMRAQDTSHRFAIGEHTLLAIGVLDECKTDSAGGAKNRYFEAFHTIQRPDLLYLATLLHDTGKGLGSDHQKAGGSLVPAVCHRLHLNQKDSETVRFLVENHLLMAYISQRRNLDDPAVIEDFVKKLGHEERLHMLFLLTHADGRAVGSESWNEWKETLLYELYIRSRQRFWEKARGIELMGIPPWEVGTRAVEFLKPHIGLWELEEHVKKMPPSYFRFLHPQDMASHVELLHLVRVKKEAVALQWVQGMPEFCRVLNVCTHDRLGLFTDIVGVLTVRGLNILNATAYTREDGIILDFFVVTPWEDSSAWSLERERAVEEALRHILMVSQDSKTPCPVLSGPPLKGRPERPLITMSNDVCQRFTVLEVEAHDAPGLLHAISRSLTRMGLDISLARVTTEGDRALDVFYVTDAKGAQIRDTQRMWAVKQALEKDLTGVVFP